MLEKIKENVLTVSAFILIAVLFVLIGLKEGFVPFVSFPALGITYPIMGTAKMLSNEMSLTIKQVLYPGGTQLNEFFLPYFIISLFNKVSNSLVYNTGLFYFITYAASFISLVILFNKITKKIFISGILTAMFFLDPYFVSQSGIPAFHVALMLMPVSLLFDAFVFEKGLLLKKQALIYVIILGYFARLLITLTSAYLAVIMAISSCLFFLIYYISSFRSNFFKRQECKIYLYLIIIPWVLALWTMKTLMPPNTASLSSSLEVLRACSPDLLTILFPSNDLLLSKVFSIKNYLAARGKMFSGDLTMWQNYFGYTLIFSSIWIAFKKSLKNKVVLSLLTVGLVMLIFGLGPSLKINSTIAATDTITGQSYSLSREQVIMDFPWYSAYKVFPLDMMRAVYRWLIIPKLLLLVGLAFALKHTLDNRRLLLCGVLISLALLEVTPKHFDLTAGIKNLNQVKMFKQDVIYPLEGINFKSTDKVIFLPSENDYLVPYMAAKADFITYNGAGDKAIALAWDSFPKPVQQILVEQDTKKIAKLILRIKKRHMADYVILTFFNPRWDSYQWPVSSDTYNKLKNRALKIEAEIGPKAEISHYKYFDVIKL